MSSQTLPYLGGPSYSPDKLRESSPTEPGAFGIGAVWPTTGAISKSILTIGVGTSLPMTMDTFISPTPASPTFNPDTFEARRFEPVVISNAMTVDGFLQRNPDLVVHLESIVSSIEELQSVSSLVTNHYRDPDEGFEKIFIDVTSDSKSDEELDDLEDFIMERFIEPRWQKLKNRLVVSIV